MYVYISEYLPVLYFGMDKKTQRYFFSGTPAQKVHTENLALKSVNLV